MLDQITTVVRSILQNDQHFVNIIEMAVIKSTLSSAVLTSLA